MGYLKAVQKHRDAKPEPPSDKMLALESALTDVRLSVVDQKLGNGTESAEYVKRAQQEFSALGWTNVSAAHLQNVVYRWDAQYRTPDQIKSSPPTVQSAGALPRQ